MAGEYLVRDVVHYMTTLVDEKLVETECMQGGPELMAWLRLLVNLRTRTCRWLRPSSSSSSEPFHKRLMMCVIRWAASTLFLSKTDWTLSTTQSQWLTIIRHGHLTVGSYRNGFRQGWSSLIKQLYYRLSATLRTEDIKDNGEISFRFGAASLTLFDKPWSLYSRDTRDRMISWSKSQPYCFLIYRE